MTINPFRENPLKPKLRSSQLMKRPANQNSAIFEDHVVRKNVATKEGTIEKTPVNDNDIANKAYVDSVAVGGGVSAHSELTELDYESSGHTGFASSDDLSDYAKIDCSNLPFTGTLATIGKITFNGGTLDAGTLNSFIINDAADNIIFRGLNYDSFWVDTPEDSTAFQVGPLNGNIVFTGYTSGVPERIMMNTEGFQISPNQWSATPKWPVPTELFEVLGASNAKVFSVSSTGNVSLSGTVDGVDVATLKSNYDTHVASSAIHFEQSAISIPASQISDFDAEVTNNVTVASCIAFTNTPSTVITAGDNLSWDGNTLDAVGATSGDMSGATFYDEDGGTNLTTSYTTINLDATETNNDTDTFTLGSNAVTVATTGLYEISYTVGFIMQAGTRGSLDCKLVNGSTDITSSIVSNYWRADSGTAQSATKTIVVELTADDAIHIEAKESVDGVTTVANMTTLTIVRLSGAKGDTGATGAAGNASFKQSDSTFTDNDTAQTFTDEFCTATSLVTVALTGSQPAGTWSVESAAGSFTITSTETESTDITFDYYIIK